MTDDTKLGLRFPQRRWTIEACPKCFARIDEEPRGCDHCEDGGYLEHIEVVPVAALRDWIKASKSPNTRFNDYEQGEDDAVNDLCRFLDGHESGGAA